MIETVNNQAHVQRVTYSPAYSVICSIGRAPFWGTIDIKYKPGEELLEFESFERWLHELALEETTVEDLCRLVFDALREALGDIPLAVTVHAMTTVHAPVSAQIKQGEV